MYINFEQMMTSGLTMSDVGYLLMIRQKDFNLFTYVYKF
nr:MAG TPA: hypothetical protein [Caudoviricetes sp.]